MNALVAFRGEYYRVLTAAFLHGGPLHLLGNMLSLHWIGPDVERSVGRPCFTAVYLLSALGGGLMHYAFGPMGGALVGASGEVDMMIQQSDISLAFNRCPLSGAISGLLGGTLVHKLQNRR